ncbi:hypothetical protein EMCRGX_G013078 [Ephydatia muelleri]
MKTPVISRRTPIAPVLSPSPDVPLALPPPSAPVQQEGVELLERALRDTSRSGSGCNVCWLLRDRLRWLYSSTATFDLETFLTMALLNPTCENDLVNSPYSSECGPRFVKMSSVEFPRLLAAEPSVFGNSNMTHTPSWEWNTAHNTKLFQGKENVT